MLTSSRRLCVTIAATLLLSGCGAWPWQQEESQADAEAERQAAAVKEQAVQAAAEEKVIAANKDENNIYFPLGGVKVSSRGKAKLQQHAEYLKANPETSVTLIGYTDDLGSRSYNVAIAEQRVAAVRQILRAYRVPSVQIHRYSVGSEKTPAVCKTPRCRQKMRRVELVYSPE
ncbi:MAG: OmpA family protein [Candidatus Accumulibacter sp.]|uniref:OmpA family protein n=1 Tax=Accumulibacter sp. TaxID=2053492 RepID=UPI0025E394FB|nr:OmpA family protein [Accumulibacter sp.]MCP5247043.1 OmpA family protein [Accumulibacter sp.]